MHDVSEAEEQGADHDGARRRQPRRQVPDQVTAVEELFADARGKRDTPKVVGSAYNWENK